MAKALPAEKMNVSFLWGQDTFALASYERKKAANEYGQPLLLIVFVQEAPLCRKYHLVLKPAMAGGCPVQPSVSPRTGLLLPVETSGSLSKSVGFKTNSVVRTLQDFFVN